MLLDEEIFMDNIVKKPWGYEYLIFKNKNLSIWLLSVNKNEKTSFHCHSKKLTGLICLSGKVEISFFEDKQILKEGQKIIIRRGLFHSSKSLDNNTILLEVETPSEKDDLIRLNDEYGRENSSYETKENYILKDNNCFWMEEAVINKEFNNYIFKIINYKNIKDLEEFTEKSICIVLTGNIYSNNDLKILIPGDCFYLKIYNNIKHLITNIDNETKILILERKR